MRLLHGTCWKDANTNYYDVIDHGLDDRDDDGLGGPNRIKLHWLSIEPNSTPITHINDS